ncbi:MAG: amino acid racemase [Alteromonadaceae bacterium]|nr:amino acid racemase [Alteromonadaceae bacterium]
MKHIGIAAITAEGAALVYRNICRRAALRLGEHCHPEISLHSFSFSRHVHANENRLSVWADLILETSHKLKASGADFMICPANSTHEVYALVQKDLPIPWLHIAETVSLQARVQSLQSLLLLGTQYTINSGIYDQVLSASNIRFLRPKPDEIEVVHDFIVRELIAGQVSPEAQCFFGHLVRKYQAQGADGVILGCTELPLILPDACPEVPVLDSTLALADAAVSAAIEY